MSLQIMANIDVDFYDKKYIMINAKQYDSSSRWISITCYNQGNILLLKSNQHSAYVKYKKADGYGVLNSCKINSKGEVLVELTEQMLAADGICYVDLVIVDKGFAMLNVDTGEVIAIDDSPILSTMAFSVNVYEASVDNSLFESSYEYDALNDLLQRAEADYSEVIKLSRSYAIGDANGIRYNEDIDNSKYYCNKSSVSASNSKLSEEIASDNADLAKSYAIGNTGIRNNEDSDNSKYYYEMAKNIANGLSGGFIPMGTISFTELPTAEKVTGFTYNISDDFVTDGSFREGAGKYYTSGTNVYCTADGYWDCLGGSVPIPATVDEIITYLGL